MLPHTLPPSAPDTALHVEGLCKQFDQQVVLKNISLTLPKGRSLGIIGGSGTGKSVLIKCILNLITPDAGHIDVNGHRMDDLSVTQRHLVYDHIGMLFQGGALFDSMTVFQNIAFALRRHKLPASALKDRVMEALDSVNLLPETGSKYPAHLSGGMQKRVALARAIVAKPILLFFDEPTAGLDPITSQTINVLIKKCVQDLGASALTITHDMHSLRHIADTVGLLHQGCLIWQGQVDTLDTTDNPYVVQFVQGNTHGPLTDPHFSTL